jgi:hypothetical protein
MIIMVLTRFTGKSQAQISLPPENIIGAIRAQIRYVRHSQAAHVLIVRAGLFTLCSSALLSLLPLLARHDLKLDSTGFGLLLGSFGTGAIIGGIVILPKLRSRASVESLIAISIGLLAAVIFMMGYIHDFGILCVVMGIGGAAYITILSQFYVIGIKSAPKWIGARVLAVYLLILNGGVAIGSVTWGIIANTIGIPITLSIASLALAATIITRKRYSTTVVDDLDLTPAGSDYWPLPPQLSIDPANNEGQALVTIDYKIDPKLSEEFEKDVLKLGTILKGEGMSYWKLFQDPADSSHYVEIRIADTWIDHMRQHERVTKNVKLMEDSIRALLKDCPQPIVSHYVAKSASK